jgi:hypothetical protein
MSTTQEHNEASPRLVPSTRFTMALLVCFGLFIQYAQRQGMSIAIVCMVNRTDFNTEPESMLPSIYNNVTTTTSSTKTGGQLFKMKQFRWTELEQQLILGSYWIGYILTLVPGSYHYRKN